MRWVCGVLGAIAGCTFAGGDNPGGGEIDANAGLDAPVDCNWSHRPALFDPCAVTFTDPPAELDGASDIVIDTSDSSVIIDGTTFVGIETSTDGQADGVVILRWGVTRLDLADIPIRVIGRRALLIASNSDLIIRGDVDLTGQPDTQAAGADHVTACPGSFGEVGTGASGGGGGGGVTPGAAGQDSSVDTGGAPGVVFDNTQTLRGGCAGGPGGASGGAGGAGGGALFLAARDLVRVDSSINAGGGGGLPGTEALASGGGGGGSGGQLGIEAPMVVLTSVARLAANGGGGGGGSSTSGAPGEAGAAANTDGIAAIGGSGGPINGGTGGTGAVGATGPVTPAAGVVGGGGGGGGARGRITLRGTIDNNAALISPAANLDELDVER